METPLKTHPGKTDDDNRMAVDLNKTSQTKNQSDISNNILTDLTFEPYEYRIHRRKKNFKPNLTLQHFESLFGINNWSRYLVLKTSGKITSAKLENILLTHCSTKDMSFRPIQPNEWLIQTTTKAQSDIYQSLNDIEGIEVSVKKHDTLNSIQGTVILPDIEDEDNLPNKALLLDSLQKRYSNVQDLEIYEIPSKNSSSSRKLKIGKIKFEGQTLPDKIKIQGQSRELRPFIPKPLQCKMCSKYGHSEKRCYGKPVCAFCSSEDHMTKWNCGTPKCVNCGSEHHARSKQCAFYTYNTELKLLVDRTGMSFKEARLELKARGFQDPARNPLFKAKVKNIVSEKALNIYKETLIPVSNSKTEKIPVNRTNSKTKEPVATSNFFDILSITPEDPEDNQSEISNEVNEVIKEVKVNQNPYKKRSFEKLSPVKAEDKIPSRSVKPKIIREATPKIEDVDKVEEKITPSPVFPTKFKTLVNPSKIKTHGEKCQCIDCVAKELRKQSMSSHTSSCGCHDCFLQECNLINPLTKDKLINVIRNFISFKEMPEITQLESHHPECMCKDHLLFYKKNKVSVSDKFLKKQSTKESSLTVTTD